MDETRYFVCVIGKELYGNWDICKRIGSFGVKKPAVLMNARAGDKLLTYFARRGFVAISTITGSQTEVDDNPWGDEYRHRIPFSLDAEYETAVPYNEVPLFASARLQNAFLSITAEQYHFVVEMLAEVNTMGAVVSLPQPPLPSLHEPTKNMTGVVPPTLQDTEISSHTKIQWQLVQLAEKVGCNAWVARGDRNRTYQGQSFAQLSHVLDVLPDTGITKETRSVVENIDVLWLQDDTIVCAFEIEHTTSIYSGLLRMSDLITTQPNTNIRLFIVASEDRKKDVIRELNRPTFKKALKKPLGDFCQYIGYAKLEQRIEHAKIFGRGELTIQSVYSIAEECKLS